MTTLLKLTLVALVVYLALGTTSVTPSKVDVGIDTPSVSAQVGINYCVGQYFSEQLCIQQCQLNPFQQGCAGNQSQCATNPYAVGCQQYCTANPQLCPGYTQYNSAFCLSSPGTCTPQYCATYPQQCQGYGTTANSAYCMQNPSICTPQFCATSPATCYTNTNTTNIYCQPASYNAQLCAQNTSTNVYCQPASYNAALCAQSGQQNFCAAQPAICTPQFCQVNPQLCGGYQQAALNTTAASVNVQSASSSIGCNGTMSLVIQVAASNGQPVANGTTVSLSASSGQVTPTSGTTSNGSLTALYSAPSSGTSATITATVGGVSGNKALTINCGTTPSTTAPAAPPPAALPITSPPPPPPAGTGVFTPPNTGDGGLLATRLTAD
jgi:hypothetical protein